MLENTSTNFERQPKYTSNNIKMLNLNLPSLYVSLYKNMVTCIKTQNVPIILIHL